MSQFKIAKDGIHGNFIGNLEGTASVAKDYASSGSIKAALDEKANKTHSHTEYATTASLNAHTGNSDIHVTATSKSNWNIAYSHSQAAHAPSDAEKNVQSDWNETNSDSDTFIQNKPTIPEVIIRTY